jgi:hypothetical protein
MSGAKIEGRMPDPRRVRASLDESAKRALRETVAAVLPIVREEAPGGLGSAMTTSVRRTPDGYRAVIAPSARKRYKAGGATGAQVVRWVTRGTGIYRKGPGPKRKITSKRGVFGSMVLPGGRRVRTVRGQHANPFVARAEQRAQPNADRALRHGAEQAGAALRKL